MRNFSRRSAEGRRAMLEGSGRMGTVRPLPLPPADMAPFVASMAVPPVSPTFPEDKSPDLLSLRKGRFGLVGGRVEPASKAGLAGSGEGCRLADGGLEDAPDFFRRDFFAAKLTLLAGLPGGLGVAAWRLLSLK